MADEVDFSQYSIDELKAIARSAPPTEEAGLLDWALTRPDGTKTSISQIAADIPIGVARAGAGLADILSLAGRSLTGQAFQRSTPTFSAAESLQKGLEQIGYGEETPLQRAVSFMTPIARAKLGQQALAGLLSYGGAEIGKESGGVPGEIAGAVLAPTAGQLSVSALRGVAPIAQILAGSTPAMERAVSRELIAAAGPEGVERLRAAQTLPEALVSPLGQPLTAAEIAQTPGLASVQYQYGKEIPIGQLLTDTAAARKAAQEIALSELGRVPQRGELAAGLRQLATQAAAEKAAKEANVLESLGLTEELRRVTPAERGQRILEQLNLTKESDVVKSIDTDIISKIPTAAQEPSKLVKALGESLATKIATAREAAKEAGRTAFKDPEVYNVSVDLPNIRKDVKGIVSDWKRDPSQRIDDARITQQIKQLKALDIPTKDLPEGVVATARIGELHNIQVELGKVIAKAKTGETTPGQALAKSLYNYVGNIIDKAPGSEKLLEAKSKWRSYFDTFVYDRERQKTSPLKAIIGKSPEDVVTFLTSKSVNVEALKKAGIDLTDIETQKLSEFVNLPNAKKKRQWIETNRPKLSETGFWPSIENYAEQLKTVAGEPSTVAAKRVSEVVDLALRNPENAADIVSRTGGKELRDELLTRLEKQGKKAQTYLRSNLDTFKAVFGSDVNKISEYATSVGTPDEFAAYAKIEDATIPKTIFSDVQRTKDFMAKFKGTEAESLARGRFIADLRPERTGLAERLNNQDQIARALFGDDLNKVQTVVNDIESSRLPFEKAITATGRQSITGQVGTTMGYIFSQRALIKSMKLGQVISPGLALYDPLQALSTFAIGRLGALRDSQMNEIAIKMLKDPKLIDLAAAPPTVDNVKRFTDQLTQLGYFATKAKGDKQITAPESSLSTSAETPQTTETSEADEVDFSQYSVDELKAIAGMAEKAPEPSAPPQPVAKQNISALIAEQPPIIQAIIKTESAGKPKAVSSKGAQGLMQLMPGTAKELGVDPTDPAQNIEGGTRYFNQMKDQFGDTKLALAAYNWGPGNLKKAQAKVEAKGKKPTWENVLKYVSVPNETEQYVKKVLSLA